MKKILSLVLVLVFTFFVSACNVFKVPSSHESEPEKKQITAEEKTDTPKTVDITSEQAFSTAENLINCYIEYVFIGVCCEGEFVFDDLSQFLTESQKEDYYSNQLKITCCSSKGEIKEHILSCFDKALVDYDYFDQISEYLFCDDNNNWYLSVVPMGAGGYTDITVEEYSNDKIIAKGYYFSEGSIKIEPDIFTIEKQDDNFVIADIQFSDSEYEMYE